MSAQSTSYSTDCFGDKLITASMVDTTDGDGGSQGDKPWDDRVSDDQRRLPEDIASFPRLLSNGSSLEDCSKNAEREHSSSPKDAAATEAREGEQGSCGPTEIIPPEPELDGEQTPSLPLGQQRPCQQESSSINQENGCHDAKICVPSMTGSDEDNDEPPAVAQENHISGAQPGTSPSDDRIDSGQCLQVAPPSIAAPLAIPSYADISCSEEPQGKGCQSQSDPFNVESSMPDDHLLEPDDNSDIVSMASFSEDSEAGSEIARDTSGSDSSDSEAVTRRKPCVQPPGGGKGVKRVQVKTPREWIQREVTNYLESRMKRKRKYQGSSVVQCKALKRSTGDVATSTDSPLAAFQAPQAGTEQSVGSECERDTQLPVISHDTTHVESFVLDTLDFDAKRMLSGIKHRGVKAVRKIFGSRKSRMTDSGMVEVKQLESTLRPKQVFAIHWMIKQEEIPIGLRGGILAADMGTGKTIMSLAVIASNKPDDDDRKRYSCATLVIVPNHDVAQQWQKEISKHCREEMVSGTTIFNSKVKSSPPCFYKKQNVVIATYADLRSQRPSEAAIEMRDKHWDNRKWRRKMEKNQTDSPLFSVGWYRVVLDEGHKIKNMRTQTFGASADLKTKYRWCLTGTPLTNTDEELFSYLTFLSCDFAKNKGTFFEKFKQEHQDALDKKTGKRPNLDALVSTLMYRLSSEDSLTCAQQQDIAVPLSPEENIVIFKMSFLNARIGINFRRQGLSHVFALDLMMLRAENLDTLIEQLEDLEDKKSALDLLETRATEDSAFAQFKLGFDRIRLLRNDMIGGAFSFAPLLRAMIKEQETRNMTCTECKEIISPRKAVRSLYCSHVYCSSCLPPGSTGQQASEVLAESDSLTNDGRQCAEEECNSVLFPGQCPDSFSALDIQTRAQNFQSRGQDHHAYDIRLPRGQHPTSLLGDFDRISIPPSSKLTMAMAIMLTWRQTHPEDKIIAFLSFRSSARVLGQMLRQAGESFLYKFGSMGDSRGTAALETFKASPRVPILIAGLDCCAEALNLTEANRVLLIDLGWNKGKEEQAFARVNRPGQTKQTHFVRLVSDGDDRTVEIQHRKSVETDYAMRRDKHKVKALTAQQYNALLAPETDSEEDEDVVARKRRRYARVKTKRPKLEELIREEPKVKEEPIVIKIEDDSDQTSLELRARQICRAQRCMHL